MVQKIHEFPTRINPFLQDLGGPPILRHTQMWQKTLFWYPKLTEVEVKHFLRSTRHLHHLHHLHHLQAHLHVSFLTSDSKAEFVLCKVRNLWWSWLYIKPINPTARTGQVCSIPKGNKKVLPPTCLRCWFFQEEFFLPPKWCCLRILLKFQDWKTFLPKCNQNWID